MITQKQQIKCPECGLVQTAIVEDAPKFPFPIFIHHCTKCKYTITESEWEIVENKKECDHYFPATENGYLPCEFCGTKHKSTMENKTALMQLIEILKNKEELSVLHKEAYKSISYEARKLLPIEKQQIEDAFVAGDERGTKDIPFNAEQYYSQTFKSKENDRT